MLVCARRCAFGNIGLRQTRPPTRACPAHRPPFATCVLAGTSETRRSLPFQRRCFSATSARRRESVVSRRFCASGLANASPSQTDDIRAHRQQNGDAYRDNDQEEFAHCSVSRRAQRQAAGIVLCWQANTPAFAKRPAIEAGLRKSGRDRDQIATP